jgi:hypothetical protein
VPLAQVHAYVGAAGGRTAYLAELKSGSQVLVADALGRQRSATVGRVKVERRPLVRNSLLPSIHWYTDLDSFLIYASEEVSILLCLSCQGMVVVLSVCHSQS